MSLSAVDTTFRTLPGSESRSPIAAVSGRWRWEEEAETPREDRPPRRRRTERAAAGDPSNGGGPAASSPLRRGAAAATSRAKEKVPSKLPGGGGGGGGPAVSARCCTRLPPRAAAAPISSAGVTWPRAGRRGRRAPPPARARGLCAGILRRGGACGSRGRAGAGRRASLVLALYAWSGLRGTAASPCHLPPRVSLLPFPASLSHRAPAEEYDAFPRVTSHPPWMRLRKLDREEWAFCGEG